MLDIDHSIMIPSYFNDQRLLIHIAFLIYPQIGGHVLEKIALDYLNEEDEGEAENAIGEDDDAMTDSDDYLEVLEGPPLGFKTPRRKRARIARDQLDDIFLRRSVTP
jgi:hypothetical protein